MPDDDPEETDRPEQAPENQSCAELSPDDAPPIPNSDLSERHGPDDQRCGLGTGIATAADDEWHEEGEDDRPGDLLLVKPHRRRGEHLPEKQRGQPAPPLPNHSPEPDSHIRRVERLHAADFLNVLGRLLADNVDDVVDGHDPLHSAFGVHDGDGDEIVIGHDSAHDLLILLIGDGHNVGTHHLAHPRLGLRAEQLAEGHDSKKVLLLVQYVGVVDRFNVLAPLLPQVADGFVNGHVRTDTRESWIHESAGGVFGVGEKRRHFLPGRFIEKHEEALSEGLRDFLQDVRRVVRRKKAKPRASFTFGEFQDEAGLSARAQREEEVLRDGALQALEHPGSRRIRQAAPGVTHFAWRRVLASQVFVRHDGLSAKKRRVLATALRRDQLRTVMVQCGKRSSRFLTTSRLVVTEARAWLPSENFATASSLCSAIPSPAAQENIHGGDLVVPAGAPSTNNATLRIVDRRGGTT